MKNATNGKELKDLRELVNLDIEDVAEITGISSKAIQLCEEGISLNNDDCEKLHTFYNALFDSAASDFDSMVGLIRLACDGITHIRTMFETTDDISSAEKKAEERYDLESVKSLKNLRQQVIERIRKKADSLERFLVRICDPEYYFNGNINDNEEETSSDNMYTVTKYFNCPVDLFNNNVIDPLSNIAGHVDGETRETITNIINFLKYCITEHSYDECESEEETTNEAE